MRMCEKIRVYGDKILNKEAKEVEDFLEAQKLIQEMVIVMKECRGLGLAAPQIGKPLKLFIIDMELLGIGKGIKEFLNPRLVYYEGEEIMEEGCLSLPGLYLEIPRPAKVVMEYTGLDGDLKTISAENLFARVLLHEYDHINGILIVDRLPETERSIMIAKWRKLWKKMKEENLK